MYKPNTVQVELVQGCNRKCSFCGTRGIEHKIHFISKKVLTRECQLIQESGYNPRILVACHGEPSLHPKFIQCLMLMRNLMPKAWIQVMTNGYLVNKDVSIITDMYSAGVNDISLDEYSDSKFTKQTIKEEIERCEKETGIHVDFKIMAPGVPLYAAKNTKNHRLLLIPAIDERLVTTSRRLVNHCGAGMPPDTSCKEKVCTLVFREMTFRWDGWVNICCQDFRGEYRIANCMDPEIKCFNDLWLHPRFEAARRVLYHKHRVFSPCNKCNSLPVRPGLIPDHLGKETMPFPTKQDKRLVYKKNEPLAKIVPRDWEK